MTFGTSSRVQLRAKPEASFGVVGDAATVDALTYKVRLVEISDHDPVAYLHLNNA